MFKNLFKKDKKSIKEENIIVLNPVDGQVVNLDKVSEIGRASCRERV